MKKYIVILVLLFTHNNCSAIIGRLVESALCQFFGVIVAPKDDFDKKRASVLAKLRGDAIQTRECTPNPTGGNHKEEEGLVFERIKPENKFIIK